jgi:hypothetical protein
MSVCGLCSDTDPRGSTYLIPPGSRIFILVINFVLISCTAAVLMSIIDVSNSESAGGVVLPNASPQVL